MHTHGIIFDCDGTLLDSLTPTLASYDYAFEKLGERRRLVEDIKPYFGSAADRIFVSLLGDESRGLEAFEHYMDHQAKIAAQIKVHPGIRELLDRLRTERVPLGIVTGRHSRDLDVGIGAHSLAEYFTALVADNRLPKSKPAPDGILLAAERMKVAPRGCLYVGDSVMDMRAAHAAGATAVAVLWDDLVKPDEMRAENPRYFAKTPMDVYDCFVDFVGSKSK